MLLSNFFSVSVIQDYSLDSAQLLHLFCWLSCDGGISSLYRCHLIHYCTLLTKWAATQTYGTEKYLYDKQMMKANELITPYKEDKGTRDVYRQETFHLC